MFGFKRLKAPDEKSTLPFKDMWAAGHFDNRDYFALTAPLREWSTDYPMHCLSEFAGGITDDGWGIVSWHLVLYIYSSQDLALKRSKALGGNVKPLKLKCLSCFARAFSTFYSYADMILDERWHIESFICRDSIRQSGNGVDCGVTHLRLTEHNGVFELNGCAGNDTLRWEHICGYGDTKHKHEWCRPISFPANTIMQNHQHQGGPIDVDFAIPPESLNYFLVDNQVLATDATKDQSSATLFARPTGPLAFADLFEEKVRITCGEGIWVPIAEKVATKWKLRPWAHGYADIIEKATKDNFNGEKGLLGRDSHWYTNQAISNLETVFLNDESDEENRIQSFNNAKRLLNLGVEATPNDWYIKSLYKGILDLNIKDAPALIHADKIIWSTGLGLKEIIDEEFNRAIELKNNLEVAYHNYALALKQLGHVDESKDILIKLLKINPQHGPANYDLAVLYMNKGNERLELEFYDTAIKAEPGFAPPYYNIGKTFEDQGDIQNAYEYYIKAINADQYFVEPYEQIAIMFYQMNKLDEAEAMLIGALEADPRRLQTYENIIAFCNSTGRQNLVKIAKTKMLEGLPREYKSIYSS